MTINNNAAMEVYLREIASIPLLTPQQEIELAARIVRKDGPGPRASPLKRVTRPMPLYPGKAAQASTSATSGQTDINMMTPKRNNSA
jgi:hypothetical protein